MLLFQCFVSVHRFWLIFRLSCIGFLSLKIKQTESVVMKCFILCLLSVERRHWVWIVSELLWSLFPASIIPSFPPLSLIFMSALTLLVFVMYPCVSAETSGSCYSWITHLKIFRSNIFYCFVVCFGNCCFIALTNYHGSCNEYTLK